jgi:hypothetical protein
VIAYLGPVVGRFQNLQFVAPDSTVVEMPGLPIGELGIRYEGQRIRFMPEGKLLVYMQGALPSQDFWMFDMATKKARQLTEFTNPAAMMTFDITPDGKHIVFDRIKDNSDIVLIEREKV